MSGEYPYLAAGPVALYLSDAAKVLASLLDSIVDCTVTPLPSWWLRDCNTGARQGGPARSHGWLGDRHARVRLCPQGRPR